MSHRSDLTLVWSADWPPLTKAQRTLDALRAARYHYARAVATAARDLGVRYPPTN